MATTVRQVKRIGRRNASNNKLMVPAPPRWTTVVPPSPPLPPPLSLGEVDGNGDKFGSDGGAYKHTPPPPPPYRMPPQPLYGEPASIPGSATPSVQQMHTHSNKFPIEREVILSNYDKNSKIPILNEYHRKQKSAVVASDAPNVQIAWSEDRVNRTVAMATATTHYGDLRNTTNTSLSDGINVEFHRTYKAQPLALLETTNGSEPSPIVNHQDDSNGFPPSSCVRTTGRCHSTPETGGADTSSPSPATNSKPFSSRTYHTIKDMISSRFSNGGSKNKMMDQISETGLNNSESNSNGGGNFINSSETIITPKTDNHLSPHSQLVQRGVYLANSQSCNRNAAATATTNTTTYSRNGIDMITRRNQEVRDKILGQYRERAIDVGQTAGAAMLPGVTANTDVNMPASQIAANGRYIHESASEPKSMVRSAHSLRRVVLDCETPNRYRDQPLLKSFHRYEHPAESESRNVINRCQDEYCAGSIKVDETATEISASLAYSNQVRSNIQRSHQQRSHEQHLANRIAASSTTYTGSPTVEHQVHHQQMMPLKTENEIEIHTTYTGSNEGTSQLPADTKYSNLTNAIERCSISRTRSDDLLLETTDGRSPYARKDLSLKQKSKSFESLGNDQNEDELEKIDTKLSGPLSGLSSDYEKHRGGGQSDSGRGSTVYGSGKLKNTTDTSPDCSEPHRMTTNKDNQWVDIVENELKHILEPKTNPSVANSTPSDTSASPPLPPVSPDVSSDDVARAYKHKSLYSNKTETPYRYSVLSSHNNNNNNNNHSRNQWSRTNTKEKIHQRLAVSVKRPENSSKMPSTIASSSIDLDSMLDEENNTSDDELSISDARAIRKQLEGLENMYSEVMKALGGRKPLNRYPSSDPRLNRRKLYGSVSSLPSSVSSRPVRDRHRRTDDRKKFVRDIKGINKRFQRLESHVVTLARSVAHLSSEMRTQHLMIQEMEVIRNELTNLRAQTNMLTVRSHSMPKFNTLQNTEQVNSSPNKMKKLTKFFGDEPPLLRLFLKKLGYEKYANVFEKEKIGLVELPYLSEERLQKLGVPMGPRLRIIQEAQLGFPGTHENTLCIV